MQYFVPVVDKNNQPLMPTKPSRARRWIKSGKATPFWSKGLFCVRLNVEPSARETQSIAVGIDPGSKKEALTVKSAAHTYLNLQIDAVTWVKDAEETSTQMRRARRYRKTRYRQMRANRNVNQFRLPPSTRARWGWKLRLCQWLMRFYPIDMFVVEDIQAVTKAGKRRWNQSFSPLEVGKRWFYAELGKLAQTETVQGYETAQERQEMGLTKSEHKMSDSFEAHCVDSWVLANMSVRGHSTPDNRAMLYIVPLRFHRRQLHRLQAEQGGIRKPYGGTLSMGLKRGSWVQHPKYGVCYVGGTLNGRISLHNLQDGKRLCQNAQVADCRLLTYATWRVRKGVRSSSTAVETA
jgi:hypothetical protein